jgi:hypothetical protein
MEQALPSFSPMKSDIFPVTLSVTANVLSETFLVALASVMLDWRTLTSLLSVIPSFCFSP